MKRIIFLCFLLIFENVQCSNITNDQITVSSHARKTEMYDWIPKKVVNIPVNANVNAAANNPTTAN